MSYTYRSLTAALTKLGVDDPADEAVLLLEQLAGASRASLLSDRDRPYDTPALEAAIRRRLLHEPLQYILGSWSFFGCTLRVDARCLVPRPDTEVLVEEALRRLPSGAKLADLCTGSGCIAIALLHQRPDLTADALELYPATLALATENAALVGVADRFRPVCADLLEGGASSLTPPYDAILSNPPYIRTADLDALSPEVHREPQAALDGGEDGLTFYRAILRDYAPLVKPGGLILLEIGHDQADDIRKLTQDYLPGTALALLKDLGGRDRVVVLTLPSPDR